MAMTRADRREAANLLRRVLDLVADGSLEADGRAGAAVALRLEGAVLALEAMDPAPGARSAEP